MDIKQLSLLALLLCVTGHSYASDFECVLDDDLRYISLDYPGRVHLCEVSVTKLGNKREVKWYANNDSQFCVDKLASLVEKYRSQWNFKCEPWPDRVGLAGLENRQRILIDTLLKRVTEEGKTGDNNFKVTGARISSTELESNQKTALVAQLFTNQHTKSSKTGGSRTFYIEDSGTVFSTNSLAQIEDNISMPESGYQLDSAIVRAIYPSGEIEISTTFIPPNTQDESRCFGTQLFVKGEDGALNAVSEQKNNCKS